VGGANPGEVERAGEAECFVVVPVFNEQKTIAKFIAQLDAVIQTLPAIRCVVLVDDGSADETTTLIERDLPHVGWRVVRSPSNLGKGAAMRLGLSDAVAHGAKAVIFMDGDLQHDPRKLGEFLSGLRRAPVVFGYRVLSRDAPWLRRNGNRAAGLLMRILFGIRRRDLLCGFMAFRHDVFSALNWTSEGYGVEAELATIVARRRIRFVEVNVPLIYLDARKGAHLGHALRILACVPLWYFRSAKSDEPHTDLTHSGGGCGEGG
jgi:glycosyltransferase involved in cell wall biosynthesis